MATTANNRNTSSSEAFASDFERVRSRLAGDGSAWLSTLRKDAMTAFASAGFPSVRDEDWKYTNVLPALRERLEPVLPGEVQADAAALRALLGRAAGIDAAASLLVFVDGCFHASLSRFASVKGLRLASLRERLNTESSRLEPWLGKYLPIEAHAFAALNTAFLDDGAVVEIAEGAIIDAPIHLVYLSTVRERPFVSHPRNVIVAGAGSQARVVEHYLGAPQARYLTNCASEIVLGAKSTLGHVRVQDESRSGFHVARVQVEQAAGSSFVSHAFGFGAALSRTEIAVKLDGEEAECNLAGLYAIDGSRHVDHHLFVDHAKPRRYCTSGAEGQHR